MLAKPTPSGRCFGLHVCLCSRSKLLYAGLHAQIRDYRQVLLWQRLLHYELGNPLRLDPSVFKARMTYHFKQGLCILRFYPEVWNAYASFLNEKGTHGSFSVF